MARLASCSLAPTAVMETSVPICIWVRFTITAGEAGDSSAQPDPIISTSERKNIILFARTSDMRELLPDMPLKITRVARIRHDFIQPHLHVRGLGEMYGDGGSLKRRILFGEKCIGLRLIVLV